MSAIREHAEDYLAMRRALGFKLTSFGQKLLSFIDYLERHELDVLTVAAALDWAMATPRSSDEVHWSRRLMVVRVFARHLAVLDLRTEIPPTDALPHHYRRVTPHLYSPDEIDRLLAATATLNPWPRTLTWRTFISLLTVTGMRTSEACHLDQADIDVGEAVLTVRDSKFGKHRQLPVQVSTLTALQEYLAATSSLRCPAAESPVLITSLGTRLDATNTAHTFRRLLDTAGIDSRLGQRRPRLHDLRHTFAVTTLLEWYRDGADVNARMPRG